MSPNEASPLLFAIDAKHPTTAWGVASILVVADEVTATEALTALFRAQGVCCWGALSGEDALTLLVQHQPELLILDAEILAGALTGLEVLKIVKQRFPRVQVLMTTALPEVAWHLALLRAGADGYLVKPHGVTRLLSAIRNLPLRAEAGTVLRA